MDRQFFDSIPKGEGRAASEREPQESFLEESSRASIVGRKKEE